MSSWKDSLIVMVDLNFRDEFQDKDALMQKRKELFYDTISFEETGELRKGFSREFLGYLNEISFRMLNGGEDYYALFLGNTSREIDFNLGFPTASILKKQKIIFLFNPRLFLTLEEREAKAMLKHEILHILLKHHQREKVLKNNFQKLAINLAMDIAVNQYINHLPYFCERLNTVNRRFDLTLRTGETLEFYVEEIHKAILEHPKETKDLTEKGEVNYDNVHDLWAESEEEEDQDVRDQLENVLTSSAKNGIPDEILKILEERGKGEIPWTHVVKKALRTLPRGKKKTVTRLNRRQPHRLDLKGELKNHIPDLTVAIDISGSIDDRSMNGFLKEILNLSYAYHDAIRVVECDDEIRRDYLIKTIKDIKPLLKRRGGTKFSPVMEHLKEENLRGTLLIYFTDGMGEEKLTIKPIHHKTIWVVKGDKLSLLDPKGEVIYLAHHENVTNGSYGIKVMRAMLHDWAR